MTRNPSLIYRDGFFKAGSFQLIFAGAAAVADDDYAAEDHRCCKYLLPRKYVCADDNADHDCDDRLYIAVHADEGRSDASLRHRDEEVGYECSAYDKVGQLGILD